MRGALMGCAGVFAALMSPALLAHTATAEARYAPLWQVGIPIAIAALLYYRGLSCLWSANRRSRRELMWRAVAFGAGLIALVVALLSPLDAWGAELFAAHMVQHEVLMLVAAPLLVSGRPLPLFLWALPESWRGTVSRGIRARSIQSSWRWLLSGIVAWLLHALALWIWHVPRFFDAVLIDAFVHDLQHLTFLVTALIFWAALLHERRREQQGAAILFLFTTTVHTSVLGALITFASRPWYSAYLQTSTHWGLTALEDQQLGGLIMWVPGSMVYVGIALALMARWITGGSAPGERTAQPR